MYRVDDPISERIRRIRRMLQTEPSIAVVMAAGHFEWTCRRATIALGCSPTHQMSKKQVSGPPGYLKWWAQEVEIRPNFSSLDQVVTDWQLLKDTYTTRHKTVHGVTSVSLNRANSFVSIALAAATDIQLLCRGQGINLNERMLVRRNRRLID